MNIIYTISPVLQTIVSTALGKVRGIMPQMQKYLEPKAVCVPDFIEVLDYDESVEEQGNYLISLLRDTKRWELWEMEEKYLLISEKGFFLSLRYIPYSGKEDPLKDGGLTLNDEILLEICPSYEEKKFLYFIPTKWGFFRKDADLEEVGINPNDVNFEERLVTMDMEDLLPLNQVD